MANGNGTTSLDAILAALQNGVAGINNLTQTLKTITATIPSSR